MREVRGPLFGAVVLVAMLVLMCFSSPFLSLANEGCPGICEYGCHKECDLLPDGGLYCHDECNVPGATATPVPGSTPVPGGTPWPAPTPTPWYEDMWCDLQGCYIDACIGDACPPGEYRLARLVFTSGGDFTAVEYLAGCGDPPCDTQTGESAGECIIDGSGIINDVVNCLGEYTVTVSLRLPVWHADRDPYPRGMVYVPVRFWVVDAPAAEAWSDPVDIGNADGGCDDDHVGVIDDWKIGLRTEPALLSPHWDAEDCGSFDGPVGSCTWQRASWGKPRLGVGLDGQPLPAYAVTGWIPYNWYSRTVWDECEEESDWGDCSCSGVNPAGSSDWQSCGEPPTGICTGVHDSPQTEWWGRWRETTYGWKHHDSGWQFIDLTLFGYPTSWMPNPNVQQVPTVLEPGPPVGALYVPVIEVQSTNEE